jgi:hypothetical protein
MNEWKNWLLETAPTEKEMPQVEKPKDAHSHDRALADYYRGEVEKSLRVGLNNYFRSGDITSLHSLFKDLKKMEDPRLTDKIATALVGMHHIYSKKEEYGGLKNTIPGSKHYGSQTGFLFNDQPIIKSNPAEKIEPIVKMMGNSKIVRDYLKNKTLPQAINLQQILSYFISQNVANQNVKPEAPKTSRFASRAAGLSDFYKNFKR